MRKISFFWYLLVVVIVGGLFIAINVPHVGSKSVDLGHHYALVFRLTENWSLTPNDPSLGEMNIYPRGSHLAAAFVGKLVGSAFLGMHVVALGALVMVWVAILAILYAAPKRTGPANAIVMALVVVLNFGAFRIHGSEISNNYFFAQLVAQSIAMAVIAIAIHLEAKQRKRLGYAVLLGAIWLVTGVHLLPAVELLGLLAGLLVLDVAFLDVPWQERLRKVLLACLVLGTGIALVALHPAFAAMRDIANNNGDIRLGPLAPVWSVGLVSIGALWCSFSLIRAWRRDPATHLMYKYLAVYGAAVSCLCLMQILLDFFHIGSDYAAKKYAYGVVTFLFMRLALWLGYKLTLATASRPRLAKLGHPAFAVPVFALALFATAVGAAKERHDIDTWAVVNFEHQLTHLSPSAIPLPASGKQNFVMELRGMPNVVNYMFSLSVAHTAREHSEMVLLGQPAAKPLPLAEMGTILTSRGNVRFAEAPQCAVAYGADLEAVSAMCADRLAGTALALPQPVTPDAR